jgi:hypothetical protein
VAYVARAKKRRSCVVDLHLLTGTIQTNSIGQSVETLPAALIHQAVGDLTLQSFIYRAHSDPLLIRIIDPKTGDRRLKRQEKVFGSVRLLSLNVVPIGAEN